VASGIQGAIEDALWLFRVANDQRASLQSWVTPYLDGAWVARNRDERNPQKSLPLAPGGSEQRQYSTDVLGSCERHGQFKGNTRLLVAIEQ
jgi:hypothetical protein